MSHSSSIGEVVAIIQARMGSTRLPGKVLADVGGSTVLDHVLNRLKRAKALDLIVVATTNKTRDDEVARFASQRNVEVFRGSEQDVLERYYLAAKASNAKTIVRICGEDLFLDPALVDQLVARHQGSNPDYTTNTIGRTFPDGLYLEVLDIQTLQRVHETAKLPEHREHVTSYILDHQPEFQIESIQASGVLCRPEIKWSVDTQEDLDHVRWVHQELGPVIDSMSAGEMIKALDRLSVPYRRGER